MKVAFTIILLALSSALLAGEKSEFKISGKQDVGESAAFKLSVGSRVVLKTDDESYLLVELLESSRDKIQGGSIEACKISWVLVSPDFVQSDEVSAFIRYRSKKIEDGGHMLESTGGSKSITLGKLSLDWSFSSSESIYLYPSPRMQYAMLGGEDASHQE